MPEDPHYYTRNIEVDHLVTREKQRSSLYKRKPSLSKIIKAEDVRSDDKRILIIGGEAQDDDQDCTPAIVIEKCGDRISRIVVSCPCGRHSELVCEYDEDPEAAERIYKEPSE